MRRTVVILLMLVPLTVVSAGCGAVFDQVEDLRGGADAVSDRARFCLALARTAAAIEAGAPDTAAEAAEEVLARAPEGVVDDARSVVDAVRDVRDGNGRILDDDTIRRRAERLEDRTRDLCDPTT